jgi:hypothetical protein
MPLSLLRLSAGVAWGVIFTTSRPKCDYNTSHLASLRADHAASNLFVLFLASVGPPLAQSVPDQTVNRFAVELLQVETTGSKTQRGGDPSNHLPDDRSHMQGSGQVLICVDFGKFEFFSHIYTN